MARASSRDTVERGRWFSRRRLFNRDPAGARPPHLLPYLQKDFSQAFVRPRVEILEDRAAPGFFAAANPLPMAIGLNAVGFLSSDALASTPNPSSNGTPRHVPTSALKPSEVSRPRKSPAVPLAGASRAPISEPGALATGVKVLNGVTPHVRLRKTGRSSQLSMTSSPICSRSIPR
jgi:hypothetical protein